MRIAGFEFALSFMASKRFNLQAAFSDTVLRQEPIETIIAQPSQHKRVHLAAFPTFDGCYSVWAPVGSGLSFNVGKRYHWLQLETAELIQADAFHRQMEAGNIQDAASTLMLTDITDHGNGLLQCNSEEASISIQPGFTLISANYIFRLVFRPLSIQSQMVEQA